MNCLFPYHDYFYLIQIIKTRLLEFIFVFILLTFALYPVNFKVRIYAHFSYFDEDFIDVN